MRPIDENLILVRHLSMLRLQKSSPFPPTIRELQKAWKLNTTSAVHLTLQHMVERELVTTKQSGNKTYYYAVETK